LQSGATSPLRSIRQPNCRHSSGQLTCTRLPCLEAHAVALRMLPALWHVDFWKFAFGCSPWRMGVVSPARAVKSAACASPRPKCTEPAGSPPTGIAESQRPPPTPPPHTIGVREAMMEAEGGGSTAAPPNSLINVRMIHRSQTPSAPDPARCLLAGEVGGGAMRGREQSGLRWRTRRRAWPFRGPARGGLMRPGRREVHGAAPIAETTAYPRVVSPTLDRTLKAEDAFRDAKYSARAPTRGGWVLRGEARDFLMNLWRISGIVSAPTTKRPISCSSYVRPVSGLRRPAVAGGSRCAPD